MKRTAIRSAAFLAAVMLMCSIGLGQASSGPPDQVEEDWQVVISSPSAVEVGPQITTCMSPVSDSSTPFFAFNLNYRDARSFQPGGLQATIYSNGAVLDSSSQGTALCQTANETITWTQRMSVSDDGRVTCKIVNGQSTTWGQFGDAQGLDSVGFGTSATSMASYNPATSVAKSGAGWQSDRVTSMTLLRVRYYRGGQLVSTDSNSRQVTLSVPSGQ
jgi:hypothetical protein